MINTTTVSNDGRTNFPNRSNYHIHFGLGNRVDALTKSLVLLGMYFGLIVALTFLL